MPSQRPVMLMILDGWGLRAMEHGNAVKLANTPHYDRWSTTLERAIIAASEEAVGLVPDQMGNSEVGHLNLGAGRIVYQDISRIDIAIRDGSLYDHPALLRAIGHVKSKGGKLHLLGLLGDGGVHAHDEHLYALLRLAKQHAVTPVLHIVTDGRDTSPGSAAVFLATLERFMAEEGIAATVGMVSGRYYAMDRDKRWERTTLAYNVMVRREGLITPTAAGAIRESYLEGVMDEFIVPRVVGSGDTAVAPGDAIVFYNFRADRMRQIVRLFTMPAFEGRPDVGFVPDVEVLTMTQYAEDVPAEVLFPMDIVGNPLAEVLSQHHCRQFHIAETEKYPHVTYFFNGRKEEPFEGEDRTIVASPKVATYDLKPEMSAYEVTEVLLERLRTHDDDFLLINFANPDMVGHTGVLEAAIRAVETVDECAGRIVEAVLAKGGVAIVTADHGNCERMIDEMTGEPHTYHTTNLVPLFVIGHGYYMLRPTGKLADVAPTVLDLLHIPAPEEMTGRSLILKFPVAPASEPA